MQNSAPEFLAESQAANDLRVRQIKAVRIFVGAGVSNRVVDSLITHSNVVRTSSPVRFQPLNQYFAPLMVRLPLYCGCLLVAGSTARGLPVPTLTLGTIFPFI